MDLAFRILADVFCVALGCYISVLRENNKRLSRRGNWIRRDVMSDTWFKLECSCCHREYEIMEGDLADYVLNYCPNCGAKMEMTDNAKTD